MQCSIQSKHLGNLLKSLIVQMRAEPSESTQRVVDPKGYFVEASRNETLRMKKLESINDISRAGQLEAKNDITQVE